jgi:gliding motility-associated-like protein
MRKFNLLANFCFYLILTIIGAVPSYAQLNAGFSANRTEGCAPLVVQFRDESSGNPTNWRWDLGNGTLSFFQHPAATYFNPGTYTIKLVASNASQTDSVIKTQYITVHASPTVNFNSSDTSGCFPLRVQFTDLSMPGDGNIISWLWDFGDGDTSAIPSPQHTYTDAGNYNVSLQVKNNRGCIQSITRLNYIKLNNGVKADFTVGASSNCRPPTPINFTNTSTGTGSLSYQWFFGDGGSSTLQNPTYTYNAAGTYTVRLIVRNNTGCIDSIVKTNAIVIGTVATAFTSPPIVCAGKPTLMLNNSTPAPTGASWDFGDASSSTEINPIKTYGSPGNYTIKLVSIFGSCRDSSTVPIQVLAKPSTDFSGNNITACKPPLNASFSQLATGAVSYKWFFGDGDSSTQENPTHTYTSYGSFPVTLVTTNAAGCTDTVGKAAYVNIQRPQVSIVQIPQEGCVPFAYQPIIQINSPDSIISYLWNFGDNYTSTLANPPHTYTVAGVYTITLTYTTAGGCTDSIKAIDAIRVGEKPIVNFIATPRFACAFQSIRFNDLSTGPVGDRWLWSFGDGGTSTEKDPTHIYQDTGWFSVTLVVWNNGCSDSLHIPNYIQIKAPIARFIDSSGCGEKTKRWFIDRSIGATSWFWNFGDGNSSNLQNPIHSYTAPGSYIVTLTVKNDTCEHTTSRQIVIVSESAAFTANDTIVCKGATVNFSALNSSTANVRSYQWSFGDGGFGSNVTTSHIYTRAGIYSVQLIITDINGCTDTLIKPQYIKVNGPTADFTAITPAVCNQSSVLFADSSFSDNSHPIKQWIWNYGDGFSDTLTAPPFQHLYNLPGLFTVSLTVVDSIGCIDRQQRNGYLIISKPFPAFISPDTLSCTNKPIRFLNQTTGNGPFSFQWELGNTTISTALQPITSYIAEGDYSVKLIVTDRYGCKDSLTKSNYIKIRNPKAIFTISDSVATCPPLVVNFTNQSQNYTRYEWDFGDGTRSLVANPIHFYTYPGIYRAKLTITSNGGCIDSLIKIITVRGPQGTFRYDKLIGCEPTTVGFTGMTKDIVSFIWDFNDGTVVETTDSIISHTYTRRGIYLPKMILKDPQGCQVSIPGRDTIRIYGVDANFGLSEQLVCDSGLVNFRDSSVSNDLITGYRWDLGNGIISTQKNPSHFYKQTGNYPIQLIIVTQQGCTDTANNAVPIRIVESPIITIRADTGACVPAIANFNGMVVRNNSGNLQWQWNFGNGSSSNLQNPLPVTYALAGTYNTRMIGTNSSGCADTSYHNYIAYPLPIIDAGNEQIICRDAVTDLTASGAIQYSWSPAIGLSCTDCPSPKASPQINTTYYLQGRNIYGCFASDSVLIRVQQPFNIQVSRGDTLCVGESLQLFASGADQFLWSPPTGLDNTRSNNPRAKPGASIVYQVIGRDNFGCFADTGLVPVVVYPYPKVNAGEDKTVSVGTTVPISAVLSGDVTSIKWSPPLGLSCINCPNPVASPKQTTTYNIEVVNKGGCVTKDEITLFVFCDNGNLFVPNTFSPNADGNNDVFYPRGKGLFTIKTMRVFNRWGEVVFERTNFAANDATKGWDGTHKGKLSAQDVYVYTIEVICDNNTVLTYNGNIALIR